MPQDNDNTLGKVVLAWIGFAVLLIVLGQNAASEKDNTAENIRAGNIMSMIGASMLGAVLGVPILGLLIACCWDTTQEVTRGCLTSLSSRVSSCWTSTRKKIGGGCNSAGSSQEIDVEAQEPSAPLVAVELSLKEESDKVDKSTEVLPSSSLSSPSEYCQVVDSNKVMHAQSSL